MNGIAFLSDNLTIYWSAIVICLAVAAGFLLSLSLYTANGGRGTAMWVMLPIAIVLSVLLSRIIHWYCHMEQYNGFFAAITDYSSGGYVLPGMLIGLTLAVILVRKLGFADSAPRLLDALAPGTALLIALIRLSSLFTDACRGKVIVTSPFFQRLPIGSGVANAAGDVEYHFATFFVQFLLMLVLTVFLLLFFFKVQGRRMKRGQHDGHLALNFLVIYSAMELVLDSTRYDSSFVPFNGFVSLVQIISAICILGALIYYSRNSVKANGLHGYHWALWGGYVVSLAGVGIFEYLVQRYGDKYMICYSVMSLSAILMAAMVYLMCRTLRLKE